MFWHALKLCGLADQPSVRAPRVALASLILIAVAIWPFSAFPESPKSRGNDRDFAKIAAVEYLARTLSPTRPPTDPWFTPTDPILTSYTIRHTAPEVRLQFSVADDGGRLVTDLSRTTSVSSITTMPLLGSANSRVPTTFRSKSVFCWT
jgi:hypothetical protein